MALIVVTRAGNTNKHEIGAIASVGRDPSCDIAIQDPKVSRKHAVIRRSTSGEYVLSDLGSTFGTFVDGAKVTSATLTEGRSVTVGDTTISLQSDERRDLLPGRTLDMYGAGSEALRWLPIDENPRFPRADQAIDTAALERDYERLRAAYELTRAIGVEQDLDKLLHRILDASFHLLPADRAAILLLDPARPVKLARIRFGGMIDFEPPHTIIDRVVATKAGLISGDAASDERLSRSASICAAGVRSAMCVPMIYADEVIGVMHLDCTSITNAFSDRDAELFATIATHAALAIKNVTVRDTIPPGSMDAPARP